MPRRSELTLHMKHKFVEKGNDFRSSTGLAFPAWTENLREWANANGWRLASAKGTYTTWCRYRKELKTTAKVVVTTDREEALKSTVAKLEAELAKARAELEIAQRRISSEQDARSNLFHAFWSPLNEGLADVADAVRALRV